MQKKVHTWRCVISNSALGQTINKRPRIALVTHSTGGGVWTVTNFIAQVLRQHGGYAFDIILLATSANDSASVRLLSPVTWLRGIQIRNSQIEDIFYSRVGAFLTELEFQRYKPHPALTRLLQTYDLIQVVAGTPAWAAVTRLAGKPTCLFAATTAQKERVTKLQRTRSWRKTWMHAMTMLATRYERQALPQMACVFAESEYTVKLLRGQVDASRLHLGPPGVDSDYFLPEDDYCADGPIICVGRLSDPRKNVRLLLSAYASLRQQMPSAPRLILVGRTGLELADMAFARDMKIDASIDVLKDVSNEELKTLYRRAGLFVLSSDEEGLGLVILEAMACGLPIISTDCGGPATAIMAGETGVLTPVGDADALAKAMQSLLEQPALRRQMGQAGRKRIEERFSIEAAGKVYLDQYDRLLAR